MSLTRIGFTPVPRGAKPSVDHADTYLDRTGSRLFAFQPRSCGVAIYEERA